MRGKISVGVLLLILTALIATGCAAPVSQEVNELAAIHEMENLVATYCHAVDSKDMDRLMAIFSDDVHLLLPDMGMEENGKAAVQAWFAELVFPLPVMRHKVVNLLIDVNGDVATGEAYYMFSGEVNNEPSEMEGRYTYKFRKTDEGWKITELVISTGPVEM